MRLHLSFYQRGCVLVCVFAVVSAILTHHRLSAFNGTKATSESIQASPIQDKQARQSGPAIADGGATNVENDKPKAFAAAPRDLGRESQTAKGPNFALDTLKVKARFGSMYRELNLTQSQIEAFESSVASDWRKIARLDTIMYEKRDDNEMRELILRDLNAKVESVLGTEAIAAFDKWVESGKVQDVANQYIVAAVSNGCPLTIEQVDKIKSTIYSLSKIAPSSPPDLGTVDWEEVLTRSNNDLNLEQLRILQDIGAAAKLDTEYKRLTSWERARPPIHGF